jgi:6-phosphogluconolactonase (cycloisomerase 2 family)
VSPDGKHVYVASFLSDAVAAFARDKTTGALTQLASTAGCVSGDGTGGTCAVGTALAFAASIAVSPDGKHVYVASFLSDAVAVFSRNKTTGTLTQLAGTAGCVSGDGTAGACALGTALDGAFSITLSHDGKNVYAASVNSSAVAVFARDKTTGHLVELDTTLGGCVSEDGSGGRCATGTALDGVASIAVSPDGKHVYVASFESNAVAAFARAK